MDNQTRLYHMVVRSKESNEVIEKFYVAAPNVFRLVGENRFTLMKVHYVSSIECLGLLYGCEAMEDLEEEDNE